MVAGVFESGLYQWIAWLASGIAMWAHAKAQPTNDDPVDELMERLRHPVRWTMRHPVIAVRRKLDRRR